MSKPNVGPPRIALLGIPLEIGASQRAAVTALFAGAGLRCAARSDIAGRDRAVLLYRD